MSAALWFAAIILIALAGIGLALREERLEDEAGRHFPGAQPDSAGGS